MDEHDLRVAVILDFDGTLVRQDVGEMLLDEFASPEWRSEEAHWRSGAITFKELNEREFGYLPSAKRREMVRFALETAELRSGARELVDFCRARAVPVEVVSGGLDFYVGPLLRRLGLDGLPARTKLADFSRGELVAPGYPVGADVCDVTGVCKCARVWHHQKRGRRVVFVGDGNSDQCVAGQADQLYARSTLASYCAREGVAYTPYDTLGDVLVDLRDGAAGRLHANVGRSPA